MKREEKTDREEHQDNRHEYPADRRHPHTADNGCFTLFLITLLNKWIMEK